MSKQTLYLYNTIVKLERNLLVFYIFKKSVHGSVIFVYFEIQYKIRIVEMSRKIIK